MTPGIAIVGLACRYPDATSPAELWENVLAQRRAFRRMPPERLDLADYYSTDPHAPDRTYATMAALIEDYEFDRVRYRVSGSSFRSADFAHWLALDIAARALADAGFEDGQGLPRENTAVYLGNTLTGEFSRAATLRLRWPYVRRVLAAALSLSASQLAEIEHVYKRPFAEVGEESLAGGLSNTIAGRISNHFDLKGGGFTVDGACASSLLAVATACSALSAGDCDVALAGGVDLSLDPFELVGFAKAGALAVDRMRVYDARSSGFWPGEGCGFAVLMRQDDATALGRRAYAVICGWGISSDGSGGITRPEVEGQLLALRRAYRRAGFGAESVGYFEGHGTGTAVGDATELQAIARARMEVGADTPAAAIGSVKANIGHTKAAAGIAGLIKASMAVHTQVIPPTVGCEMPHPAMGAALRALAVPEVWPGDTPLRAAVSAMGFGGINSHVVMEGAAAPRRSSLATCERRLAQTPQDAELFVFESAQQMREIAALAPGLSLSEMTDLAASLTHGECPRFAAVAATPEELAAKLSNYRPPTRLESPRIGFLFPGQGSQNTSPDTEVAQPGILRDSLIALRRLRALGIEASVAVGHSLGELTALCWAGAIDEDAAVRIAEARGRLMADVGGPQGGMAGVGADEQDTRALIGEDPVVIAGLNSDRQTVVSGAADAVQRVILRARDAGFQAVALPVSHAFHSPLVASAAEPFAEFLRSRDLALPIRRVISTVTGAELAVEADLIELLRRQIASPVRFREALVAAGKVDLWIEVGPGRILSGLASHTVTAPAMPLESGAKSLRAFLEAVAAAIGMGAVVHVEALFEDRFSRPFRGKRKFFVNPCETAPRDLGNIATVRAAPMQPPALAGTPATPLDVLRALVAERTELPPDSIAAQARFLADLHLNSIVVAQIATAAARQLGIAPPAAPLEYAGLSVAEMAEILEAAHTHPLPQAPEIPAGIDSWVRIFRSRLVPRPLVRTNAQSGRGEWQFFGPFEGTPRAMLEQRRAELPGGGGVVLCLDSEPDEGVLLEAARAAVRLRPPARFVVVQHGGRGAASLARTVFLESRDLPVCVVDLPSGLPRSVDLVVDEAGAVRRYTEAHYDCDGKRHEPALQVSSQRILDRPDLGPDDVILVAGGAKGIGAECAIEAARVTGAKLALLGTSAADHPSVEATLARMLGLGIAHRYYRADVTDAAAVRAVAGEARADLGAITAILHCAGINRPRSIDAMEEREFRRTIEIKTRGLHNLLAAGSPELKLAIAFGSIIARMGMQGEADYALANEWMAHDLELWGREHPRCRCRTLEWSVWAGAGMGERVAHLESLRRKGVSPITIEEGLRAFREALRYAADEPETLVVAGRFGAPPTLQFEAAELPLLRFVEKVRVHYPRVELVCEAELSEKSDPYLGDHVFAGALLLPGVVALEAMAQAAVALTGGNAPSAFEDVRFVRPVIIPKSGSLTIRLLALSRSDGTVEVALRTAETGFQADHFRAVCRFGSTVDTGTMPASDPDNVALDPARHLYGGLLFQEGRFRRLRAYQRLRATECVAEAEDNGDVANGWFNRYFPQTLVLGDAGVRDAAIHCIQACIPHARVLPGGARRISISSAPAGPRRIHARELSREGDQLVYDMEIATLDGEVIERWSEMELRIIGPAATVPANWPPPLLAPYLERRVAELVPQSRVAVTLGANGIGSSHRYRVDGKPYGNGFQVSRSHAGNLTMTVTSGTPVGCDCEPVTPRSAAVWRDLLGAGGFGLAELVSREAGEDLDRAATRVWCANESMKKAGARQDIGIVLSSPEEHGAASGGWVILGAGASRIATLIAPVEGFRDPVTFAVMVGAE